MSDFDVDWLGSTRQPNNESYDVSVSRREWDYQKAEIERLTDQVVRQNTHLLSTLKLTKELKVEIERLKKASKWVSVDERLPEYSSDVLFFSTQITVEAGWFDGAYFNESVTLEPVMDATHWQPLPAPPTVQEQEEETNK
jgi:hypothetical protein